MKLSELIDELKNIRERMGKDIDVFVEADGMRSEKEIYDFYVENRFHESDSDDYDDDGTYEVILTTRSLKLATIDDTVLNGVSIVRIELWLNENEIEKDFECLGWYIDKKGHFLMDINIKDGRILKWRTVNGYGSEIRFFYKAVDRGRYTLLDSDYRRIISIDGYVPNDCIPDKDGYGDYITLNIDNETGKITNWYSPDEISFEKFISDPEDE